MNDENQKTSGEWSLRKHPDLTLNQVVKDLTEEVAELAVATGMVSADELCAEIRRVYDELKGNVQAEADVKNGIADVQIVLYALAEHQKISVQQCINEKMQKNRIKYGA